MYIVLAILIAVFSKINSGLGALVGIVGYIGVIAFAIWQQVFVQGNTGQTIGKKQVGIKLLREQDGQVIGPLNSFLRGLVHVVDAIPCYVGFLWPLWDQKKQTFADKIMQTVVIKV
jgi:uncharacterized RDD family membrane protein YckC